MLIASFIVLFFLPGWLILDLFRQWPHEDYLVRVNVAVCIGLAAIPILWLSLTTLDIHVESGGIRTGYNLFALMALFRIMLKIRRRKRNKTEDKIVNWYWLFLLSFLIILMTATRILQIRNVILPPWVDSVKHASIIKMLTETKLIPHVFSNKKANDEFIYHFGYHSIIATLVLYSNLPITQIMLYFGQFLSVLAPISAYSLTLVQSKSRRAGLYALITVGLISTMPARYVSWGRYTLLSGMVILPIALLFTLWLATQKRLTIYTIGIVAILWSGLLLTHYRVTLYGALFLLVWYLVEILSSLWYRHSINATYILRGLVLVLSSLIITSPWLVHLIQSSKIKTLLQWAMLREHPRTLPGAIAGGILRFDYLFNFMDWLLIMFAIGGGLTVGIALRRKNILLGMSWIAGLFVMANPAIISPDIIPLSDNFTFVSTVYLPIALIGGDLFLGITNFVAQHYPSIRNQKKLYGLLGALLIPIGWALRSQINVIPSGNITSTSSDLEAIRWIDENLPIQSNILINTRYWADNTYVGTDAGYWINVLTGRKTTLPPSDYVLGDRSSVAQINELARRIAERGSSDMRGLRSELLRNNVTHIFIGSYGGPLKVEDFVQDSNYDIVFTNGAAWVFVDRAAIEALSQAQLRGNNQSLEILFRRQYLPLVQVSGKPAGN